MNSRSRAERRRYKGTPVTVVTDRHRLARSPSGQANSALLPAPHVIREAIESGICPWCKRGPFKVLAGHVTNQHGIDRFELREMAGMTRHISICDPAYAEERRDLAKRIGSTPPVNTQRGRKLTLSTAGRARLQANGRAQLGRTATEAERAGSRKAGRIRGDQLRKDRQPCAACGGNIPFVPGQASKKTCSPDCLRTLKARNMSEMRGRPTACTHGHDFTPENTIVRANGSRQCRTCRERRSRESYLRRRDAAR